MKTTNKKRGFTIVELVIVIAVIAILAAVLIPTFSGVVQKAKDSAALQEATAAYKETIGMTEYASIAADEVAIDAYINAGTAEKPIWFSVEDGVVKALGEDDTVPNTVLEAGDDVDIANAYFPASLVLGEDAPANVYVYASYTAEVLDSDPVADGNQTVPAYYTLLGGDI